MALTSSSLLGLSTLSVGLVFLINHYRKANSLPLPPGPPAHPIFGNARDIPATNQWLEFTRLGRVYGPVMHLRVLSQHIIILSSLDAVLDLLDKRGNIYSDRPEFIMLTELSGWGCVGSVLRYGETWRAHRRVYHHFFHQGATKDYLEQQTKSNLEFLDALRRAPHQFFQHLQTLTASSIMSLAYGIKVDGEDDPWVKLADEAIEDMTVAGMPGSFLVEWIPALKYVPAWFPGASFKRRAQESQKLAHRLCFEPLEWTREQIRAEKSGPSIAASLIQNGLDGRPIPEDILAHSVATIYLGGAETTVSLLASFFLCMVLYPAEQKAAQEEIDRVLGHGRIPELADRDALPYVDAVMLEVIRLYPVLPLSLPRQVMEDDEYQGMRIPKGSTILPNVWAILRDESHYPEPHRFRPERYLKNGVLDLVSVPDPRTLLFGFGRRICPGRHFADAATWMAIASVLACFSIAPAKDEKGNDVPPTGELRTGAVTCPRPFECNIVPRSECVYSRTSSTRIMRPVWILTSSSHNGAPFLPLPPTRDVWPFT